MGEILYTDKWEQVRRVTIGDLVIDYQKDLDIHFNIAKNNGSNSNVALIKIFNLSLGNYSNIKKNDRIVIEGGHKDNFKTLFLGTLESEPARYREGPEIVSEFSANTNTEVFKNFAVDRTFNEGKTALEICKLITENSPFNLGEIDLTRNVQYSKGKSFSTSIDRAFSILAKDTGSKLSFDSNNINLVNPNKTYKNEVVINSDSGLIYIVRNDDKYMLEMILEPSIEEDSVLLVESREITGKFKVEQVQHKADDKVFSTIAVLGVVV